LEVKLKGVSQVASILGRKPHEKPCRCRGQEHATHTKRIVGRGKNIKRE